MTRVVEGADGRVWMLRGDLEWRTPATADDFQHDLSAGRGPALVMLALVVLLAVILVSRVPDNVVGLELVLPLLALLMLFFPLRWALRRPWTVVAETGDDGESIPPKPIEKWTGTVRGVLTVRQQMSRIARTIQTEGAPGLEGPLRPVD